MDWGELLVEALRLGSSIREDIKEGRNDEAKRKSEYLQKALEAYDRRDLSGCASALAGMPIPERSPDDRGG